MALVHVILVLTSDPIWQEVQVKVYIVKRSETVTLTDTVIFALAFK